MKLLFIGAHPDDGDAKVGGLAARTIERGGSAMLVSVTNGNAGHQTMQPDELARTRKEEARRSGEVIGAEYVVLDHDDARLKPTVEIREELIGLIRSFQPDLLLALRTVDYHADHRAAAELVMDAAYLLTVPLVCPGVPILQDMPVVAYVEDGFKKPIPFEADVVVAVDEHFETKARMMACHKSQYFEWLAYNGGYLDQVPEDEDERSQWWLKRCEGRLSRTADRFRDRLIKRYGAERGGKVRYAEAFEISEYGRRPDDDTIAELFPK